MVTRKAKLGERIDKDILKVLKNSPNPKSTRDIALTINRSWHAVQTHCLKLQIRGRVHGFNVSNINVWSNK